VVDDESLMVESAIRETLISGRDTVLDQHQQAQRSAPIDKSRRYNDPTDDQRNRSCYWFRPGTLWAWSGGSRCAVSAANI
jgi:hypothetical protein